MTHEQTNDQNQGPLKLPAAPPSIEAARAVQKLRGHSTSDVWLPEGLGFPELDELRAKHLKVREQVAAEIDTLAALDAHFRAEDRRHDRDLQQAHRDGKPGSVEDRRTPAEQRQAEHEAAVERTFAGVIVLAEVVDEIVAWYRHHEDEVLASLRSKLGPAGEKRREAERLLAEAKTEEWALHRLGQHTQVTADAGALGFQPAPTPEEPPKQFSPEVRKSMLERPWHKRREHAEPPVVAWQDQQQPEADDELGTDDTGAVSELIETGAES